MRLNILGGLLFMRMRAGFWLSEGLVLSGCQVCRGLNLVSHGWSKGRAHHICIRVAH
jgi:hypothetical protein